MESLNKIEDSLSFRSNRKIHFQDVIYYTSYLLGNDTSYDVANMQLQIHNIAKNVLFKQKIILMLNVMNV